MSPPAAPHTTFTDETVVVGNGRHVRLRAITPADRAALAVGYRRLSDRTAYRRFFTVSPELSAGQLDFLTQLDHHGHEAIGAEDPDTGAGIGVARYVRIPAEEAEAEVAVTVADEWQGTGVGTALLARLAERARAERISVFTAELLTGNQAMAALLTRLGPVVRRHSDEEGTTVLRVDLLSQRCGPGR